MSIFYPADPDVRRVLAEYHWFTPSQLQELALAALQEAGCSEAELDDVRELTTKSVEDATLYEYRLLRERELNVPTVPAPPSFTPLPTPSPTSVSSTTDTGAGCLRPAPVPRAELELPRSK